MRVVGRKTFLSLPAGTIYAKGKPWHFDGFNVKADTLGTNDWACLSPMWIEANDDGEQFARLDAMLETGASYPMAESYGRDGCFDAEEIFLIPEQADLEKLRAMIDAALAVSKVEA
jgi:hypothetical protein